MRGGPQRITADGVVGDSGRPIRVYAIAIDSGGTAAVVDFHNGTAGTDALYLTGTGVASKSVLVPDIPASGLLFPAGLYANVDANTDAVIVWYDYF